MLGSHYYLQCHLDEVVSTCVHPMKFYSHKDEFDAWKSLLSNVVQGYNEVPRKIPKLKKNPRVMTWIYVATFSWSCCDFSHHEGEKHTTMTSFGKLLGYYYTYIIFVPKVWYMPWTFGHHVKIVQIDFLKNFN